MKETFHINNEKKVIAAIAITLIIVASTIAAVYIWRHPEPSGYSTIYLLDAQNQAVNYPHTLVINHNSSINVPVVVENHMGKEQYYQVQVKIVQTTSAFPVNTPANSTYEKQLNNLEQWENQVPISINQPGSYSVVIELWSKNIEPDPYGFTNNFCVLHLQVVADEA